MRRLLPGLLALILLGGAAAGLWYGFPVRQVTVSGNRALSEAQIRREARAQVGPGWLVYGGWRAGALRSDPWVLAAHIERRRPGIIAVQVTERRPAARTLVAGRPAVIAWDGTVLPGAAPDPALPLLSGWGPDRLDEAREAARLLARYSVRSVTYTPSGLRVVTGAGPLWVGNSALLRKYAGSVRLFAGRQINVYPWGVSVQ